MRNLTFFPRLALVNLARNGRYYGPYLFSCGVVTAMYYILGFLTHNDGLAQVRGAMYLQSFAAMGCFIAAIFSAVIFLYANSFVMKRRQRELGLYNILGLEKRHIAFTMLWETLYAAIASLAGGIAGGVLLSKVTLVVLSRLARISSGFQFSVSLTAIGETAALMGVLFALTLAANLFRLGRSRPVELLHSAQAGEREPKTRWLLTAVGVLTLGAGYVIAITTQRPVEALMYFFLAVLLVIIGTYCLFTAGSIALLKALRANRSFYYKTRHFTAVSGLLYRMKQNAVGLANICILATMVLVTVSTTLGLYLGLEEGLDEMYPYDVELIYHAGWLENGDGGAKVQAISAGEDRGGSPASPEEALRLIQAVASREGRTVEALRAYTRNAAYGYLTGNTLRLDPENAGPEDMFLSIDLVTAEDFARAQGREADLAEDEVLVWGENVQLPDPFFIGDRAYHVKERLEDFIPRNDSVIFTSDEGRLGLVMADRRAIETAAEGANLRTRYQAALNLDGTMEEKIDCFHALLQQAGGPSGVSRQENETELYAMYGGFLFLGVFLGLLFLMVTVLIIYYKQISEGYEDQRRYEIMRQVGMSPREVKASIHSQILLVFFLPLAAAGVHILAAFPMLSRMLELFQLRSFSLFAVCSAGTLLVFCLIYALVYGLTARAYDRIVQA